MKDYAERYGDADRPIRVKVGSRAVEVSNGARPVPADKLAHLADRFVRASAEPQGAGLGLAIVKSLVTQAGGRLELHSPIAGETAGFAASLVFSVIYYPAAFAGGAQIAWADSALVHFALFFGESILLLVPYWLLRPAMRPIDGLNGY